MTYKNCLSLHRRLTKHTERHFREKIQMTRSKNFSKKFHARLKRKEKQDKVDKLVASGMNEFQALFEIDYGENVRELSKQENFFADKIKKRGFTGSAMKLPTVGENND